MPPPTMMMRAWVGSVMARSTSQPTAVQPLRCAANPIFHRRALEHGHVHQQFVLQGVAYDRFSFSCRRCLRSKDSALFQHRAVAIFMRRQAEVSATNSIGVMRANEPVTLTVVSLNKPDDFILAIIEFTGDETHRAHCLRQPFQREPDFGVTSVNDDFAELLARGEAPR